MSGVRRNLIRVNKKNISENEEPCRHKAMLIMWENSPPKTHTGQAAIDDI